MIYREDRWDFRRPGGYSSQFRLSCRARCPYSVFLRKPDRRTRLNPFIIIYVIRYIVIASHVRISNGPQALRTFQLCPLVIFNSIAIYKILQSVLSRFYHYVCVFPSIHKFSSRRFFLRSCVNNAFPRHFYNCRVLLFFFILFQFGFMRIKLVWPSATIRHKTLPWSIAISCTQCQKRKPVECILITQFYKRLKIVRFDENRKNYVISKRGTAMIPKFDGGIPRYNNSSI